MKTTQFLLVTSFFTFCNLYGSAQQVSDTLNGNSVAATLFDEARLFNNRDVFSAGYELPAGSGNHLIYNSGFWFAGINQIGDLKLAASSNAQGADLYRGPYSSTGDYSDPAYLNAYQGGIWTVSKTEIIQHINDYNQPNYVATEAIENWPGNGNTNLGVADQLAPYVDVNNNNIYDPYQGDYPCIKGDVASYQIMHDDSTHSSTGGERIGAEIHMMIYQIASSNYIDSTTFIEVTIFNKGQNSFSNFKSSLFLDGDIGFPEDEYVGSNPSRNLMYNYNALNSDPGGNGQPGYGANPPAVGVVSLNKSIEYSGVFNLSSGSPQMNGPSTAAGYWYYMNGKWLDGSDWTEGGNGYGGTTPTQHLYDGNPFQSTGWTELDTDGLGTANDIGDRRFVMTAEESNFAPGDTLQYHYAVIANRRGDHIENVQGIIDYADSVQQFYDNMNTSCLQQGTVSVDVFEQKNNKLILYPNPASNMVRVEWSGVDAENIIVYSFQGELIKEVSISKMEGITNIDIMSLKKGMYFVKIGSITRKLIIQ